MAEETGRLLGWLTRAPSREDEQSPGQATEQEPGPAVRGICARAHLLSALSHLYPYQCAWGFQFTSLRWHEWQAKS